MYCVFAFLRFENLHKLTNFWDTFDESYAVRNNVGLTLATDFNPSLCSRNFQESKYIMHWLLPFFSMEAKFGPIDKKIKNICVNRDESFQKKNRVFPF